MNDLISRQALCKYALNQKGKSVTPNDIMRFPSATSDLISRQQAIAVLLLKDKELRSINWYDNPNAEGECRGIDEAICIINNLSCVTIDDGLVAGSCSDIPHCPSCGAGLEGEKAVADLPETCGADTTK